MPDPLFDQMTKSENAVSADGHVKLIMQNAEANVTVHDYILSAFNLHVGTRVWCDPSGKSRRRIKAYNTPSLHARNLVNIGQVKNAINAAGILGVKYFVKRASVSVTYPTEYFHTKFDDLCGINAACQ